MKPKPNPRHLLAVAILAAVASFYSYLAVEDDRLSSEQVQIATAAMKNEDKTLFQSDAIYGGDGLWRLSSPAFLAILQLAFVPTKFADPSLPFRALVGVLAMLQLGGMYALLYRQTRSWSISAMVAVMSSAVTYTLGQWFWGIGSLGSITPAAMCCAFVPLVLLAFIKQENSWRLMLVFAFIGLMGNIHLATSINLALVLLIVFLARKGFALSAIPTALACFLACGLCALPYAAYTIALLHNMSVSSPLQVANTTAGQAAFDISGIYPSNLNSLLTWVLYSLVLLVPAGVVLSKIERYRTRDRSLWLYLAGAGLAVSLLLGAIVHLAGILTGTATLIINFFQASAFVMPAIYILFGQGLTHIFRMVYSHRHLLRWACFALLLLWMLPSPNFRPARHVLYDISTMFMSDADKPLRVQQLSTRSEKRLEFKLLADWIKRNSDISTIVLSDDIEMRLYSRRPILASRDDMLLVSHLPNANIKQWSNLLAKQEQLIYPLSRKPSGIDIVKWLREITKENQSSIYLLPLPADFNTIDAPEITEVPAEGWAKRYKLYKIVINIINEQHIQ